MKTLFLSLFAISSLFAANDFYYEYGKKIEVQNKETIKSTTNKETNIHKYTTTEGKDISFKNQIIVKCKENAYCEDDLSDLNINNFIKRSESYYLIKVSKEENIFQLMQELHNKEDILSAHPNYIIKKVLR